MSVSLTKGATMAWTSIQGKEEFHRDDLVRFGISEASAQIYMKQFEAAGLICEARKGPRGERIMRPVKRAEFDPLPRDAPPSAEGNMWRAMRGLRQFSPTDIAAHSNVGGIAVTVEQAQSYCRLLLAAEYIVVRKKAVPGRFEAVYRLVEETGPYAPRPMRVRGLFDPNTDRFMPSDRRVRS